MCKWIQKCGDCNNIECMSTLCTCTFKLFNHPKKNYCYKCINKKKINFNKYIKYL